MAIAQLTLLGAAPATPALINPFCSRRPSGRQSCRECLMRTLAAWGSSPPPWGWSRLGSAPATALCTPVAQAEERGRRPLRSVPMLRSEGRS